MNKTSIQFEQKKFSAADQRLLASAEAFARQAHAGQKRKSGHAYITHPLAVAQALSDWGMDAETLAAGLLHDTVEDCGVSVTEIEQQFGPKVAELVDGVTKLGEVSYIHNPETTSERQAVSQENLRKLLLAMTKDLRVIVVKLADRRHNLQTLQHLPEDKQRRIAAESLEIYAPLADRLGMGQVKAEIEDLAFRYVDPHEYHRVETLMQNYTKRASRYLARLKRFIKTELEAAGVQVMEIEGRQKHLYSVYKKLRKAEGDIDKIYDLIAVRIIVPQTSDCYQAMGVLHQHFKPLIYRIKDYIAVPKPNGYRSLHTTVFALDGRITEIQIRTPQMHEEAERGLAAHFYYDAAKSAKSYLKRQVKAVPKHFTWVSGLADLHAASDSAPEFVEALKVDLFRDRIFVFSPKGDLYDLPEGSTPIDFAFSVHSDVGLRAQGAKVNGRLVPLDHKLENRDVVEILTKREPAPNRDWLGVVRTPHAKNRIRAWFRSAGRSENLVAGRLAVESELRLLGINRIQELAADKREEAVAALNYKDFDSVLAGVGEGNLTVGQVMRRLFPPSASRPMAAATVKRPKSTGRVIVARRADLPYHLAACCSPVFPQPVIGYITRGSGVTIHALGCSNLPTDEPDRFVNASWEVAGTQERLLVPIHIQALSRVGLLRDITSAVSAAGLNIYDISSKSDGENSAIKLTLEVNEMVQALNMIKKLEHLPGIQKAERRQA